MSVIGSEVMLSLLLLAVAVVNNLLGPSQKLLGLRKSYLLELT